jgi:preprotein translocase subunit SecE
MGDTNNNAVETAAKKSGSWFKGLKAEYKKIIWPGRDDVTKQTIAVVLVSLVVGVIIAVLDMGLQYGIDFIINL